MDIFSNVKFIHVLELTASQICLMNELCTMVNIVRHEAMY